MYKTIGQYTCLIESFLKQFIHLLDKFVCEVMQQEIFLNCNISPAYKNHSLPNTNIIV